MFNKKSLDNLHPFDKMDSEEHRKISSKGGKASAQAKRERRAQREMVTALLKYGDMFRTFSRLCEMDPDKLVDMMYKSNHGEI